METISPLERMSLHHENREHWYTNNNDIDDILLDIQTEKENGTAEQIYMLTLDLGQRYELADEIEKAENTYREAITFAKSYLPRLSPLVAFALLGRHYLARGKYDEAHPLFEKVVGILESKYTERTFVEEDVQKSPYIGEYKYYIGEVYLEKKDLQKALEHFHEARKIALSPIGSLSGIAQCYFYQDDYIRARRILYELFDIHNKMIASKRNDMGLSREEARVFATGAYFLGMILDSADDKDAKGFFEYSYNLYKQIYGEEDKNTRSAKDLFTLARNKYATDTSWQRILWRNDQSSFELNSMQWAFWLDLAHQFGWQPRGTQAPEDWKTDYGEWKKWDYYINNGQIMSVNDAQDFSLALMKAYDAGWPAIGITGSDNFEYEEIRAFLKSLATFFTRGSVKIY